MSAPSYTLRQLGLFVAVARHRTITRAAAELGVSPAAVSMAITELERQLGAQLVLRRPARGVELTAVGASVLAEAGEVLDRAAELRLHAQDLARHLTGRLVIGCYSALAPNYLLPILEQFAAAHPDLTVEVVEESLTGLSRLLIEGRCEAALLYDVDLDTDVVTEVLSTAYPSVVLPARHRLARREAVDLVQVRDEPMIMLNLPPSMQHTREVLEAVGVAPRVIHRSSSPEVVRALVRHGLGWAILIQQPPFGGGDDDGVVMRSIVGNPGAVDIVFARPRGVRPTRRVDAFAQFCRTRLAAL